MIWELLKCDYMHCINPRKCELQFCGFFFNVSLSCLISKNRCRSYMKSSVQELSLMRYVHPQGTQTLRLILTSICIELDD